MNRLFVIGASAGGVESLREVVTKLPAVFESAVCVVLHIPPYQSSSLPEILSKAGPLPAFHPADGAKIQGGRIYVAEPDHHLLIEGDHVAVKRGPKENRFRPSIDALFRSAAYTFGSRTVGVILSGALDDGTSGLWTIKRLGGVAIVQQPSDARFESMPLSAIEHVEVDHILSASDIGPVLAGLANSRPAKLKGDAAVLHRAETELSIAAEGGAFQKGIMEMGVLTPFTCPECHGALVQLKDGRMTRYRCHTGHAYSNSALLEGVMDSSGEMLWQVMRSLEEAVMLIDHMARQAVDDGDKALAKIYAAKARDLERRSKLMHQVVQDHESLSGDNLGGTVGHVRPSKKAAS